MKKTILLISLILCETISNAAIGVVTGIYTRAESDAVATTVISKSNSWNSAYSTSTNNDARLTYLESQYGASVPQTNNATYMQTVALAGGSVQTNGLQISCKLDFDGSNLGYATALSVSLVPGYVGNYHLAGTYADYPAYTNSTGHAVWHDSGTWYMSSSFTLWGGGGSPDTFVASASYVPPSTNWNGYGGSIIVQATISSNVVSSALGVDRTTLDGRYVNADESTYRQTVALASGAVQNGINNGTVTICSYLNSTNCGRLIIGMDRYFGFSEMVGSVCNEVLTLDNGKNKSWYPFAVPDGATGENALNRRTADGLYVEDDATWTNAFNRATNAVQLDSEDWTNAFLRATNAVQLTSSEYTQTVSLAASAMQNNGTGFQALALGGSSVATGHQAVAYGQAAEANNLQAIAIGCNAQATGSASIQIGSGWNGDDQTLQVWSWPLLSFAGNIPVARISTYADPRYVNETDLTASNFVMYADAAYTQTVALASGAVQNGINNDSVAIYSYLNSTHWGGLIIGFDGYFGFSEMVDGVFNEVLTLDNGENKSWYPFAVPDGATGENALNRRTADGLYVEDDATWTNVLNFVSQPVLTNIQTTASAYGTNYIVTLTYDATNNYWVTTETAQ